jgi:hypothetical protein
LRALAALKLCITIIAAVMYPLILRSSLKLTRCATTIHHPHTLMRVSLPDVACYGGSQTASTAAAWLVLVLFGAGFPVLLFGVLLRYVVCSCLVVFVSVPLFHGKVSFLDVSTHCLLDGARIVTIAVSAATFHAC